MLPSCCRNLIYSQVHPSTESMSFKFLFLLYCLTNMSHLPLALSKCYNAHGLTIFTIINLLRVKFYEQHMGADINHPEGTGQLSIRHPERQPPPLLIHFLSMMALPHFSGPLWETWQCSCKCFTAWPLNLRQVTQVFNKTSYSGLL